MPNYSKVVAWANKDSLADTDVNKIISGADFHDEFSEIEDSIETKAEINGTASETFAAAISASALTTSTTQVPNTAWVQALITATKTVLYPVGSIYINAAVATNPATLLGFGVWTAYATGRALVGKESSGTFDTLNEEQGADIHELSVAELAPHNHVYNRHVTSGQQNGPISLDDSHPLTNANTSTTGDGVGHNNIQRSITVYMWKRAS